MHDTFKWYGMWCGSLHFFWTQLNLVHSAKQELNNIILQYSSYIQILQNVKLV